MQHDHLSFEALVDLVEGRLGANDQRLAREHLAACLSCHSELIRVEHLLAQMHVLGDRPRRNTSAWVRAIFRAAQRATVPRRVLSTPLFDSRFSMSGHGMRSAQAVAERQVLFEATPFTVDLRILPLSDQWAVAGQVLGPVTSGTATLLSGQLSREAELSHLGEFQLPAISAARCTLVLAMATETLILPELEVGG
jgi:anti-sigma factor RsiW